MHVVIGTAGHIDHGKSALVRALTGTDPDRLKEEKERGMTTDLGFAFYSPDVTIIDVPGHERFVRHMLAGATTIDLVLLVVAADDGVMPQTVEHFEITKLLGIRRGLIVLNKCDLVDEEWRAMVEADIRSLVKNSFLESAPIVPVSALTGWGIPELRAHIDRLVADMSSKADKGIFRMPIDRNFTMKGFGTVVAGTVLSGSVRVGEKLELLPQQILVRVRGIQVHNSPVAVARIGDRAALNLQGVEREMVYRGCTLATPGYYVPTQYLNAELVYLRSAPGPFRNMTRVTVHIGTAELMGRLLLLDCKELMPGERALVQLRLERPVASDWGDRYVIRSYSPQRTIGGGIVLEASPPKARRFDAELIARLNVIASGSPESILEQQLLKCGFGARSEEQLARETAISPSAIAQHMTNLLAANKLRSLVADAKTYYVHTGSWVKAKNLITDVLSDFHAQNPTRLGMRRQELKSRLPPDFSPVLFDHLVDELVADGMVVIELDRMRMSSHAIRFDEHDRRLAAAIMQLYEDKGFEPPAPDVLPQLISEPDRRRIERVLVALLETGQLIDIGEGIILAQRHVQAAEMLIRKHFAHHEELTASEFRQLLQTTRKYAIPLLNYFDSRGVTLRRGDVRILKK